ncbi:ribonuclease R [Tianweitania sp. BSSL-BM11]|uniref:Ribonuclease R n=1 Tax=Tianweitania aestuarii TaxID=2814886 RepID=A0ABS5RTX1_9HYPH|nr:ribonuclease R [Tianweitania aestuarii]
MARRIPGTGKKTRTKEDAAPTGNAFRPSRDQLLQFITENPDQAGKREIAKAFRLKGDDRIWLKEMLSDLADDGLVEKKAKRLSVPGALPPVTVLDVIERDRDGGLIGKPVEGDDAVRVAIRVGRGDKGPAPGIGQRILAKIFANKDPEGPAYSGRVIKVLERRRDAMLGVVRKARDGWRLEPVERRQPELIIDDLGDAQPGDLVEVEPAGNVRYGLPRGRVTSVIGSLTSEKAVSMIAIHAHDIPHVFPAAVLAEASDAKPAAMGKREDWRDVPLVTIDPADAKDHDDAVYAQPDPDEANPGGVIVNVAIADVAAYVRPGSPMDREAMERGNSVYFPDRVVPMLPERISNDLCSLRENEDRPALAVRMTFAADGHKIRHSFHRIMMRSHAKIAYAQAQAAIDGTRDEKTDPLLESVLRPLWDAYEVLKRGREKRQPLQLDLPERKILLKEDGTVDRVIVPPRLDAHKLIEEFMIQANVAAAETLEAKKQALIYRRHDAPSLAKQESLREFLQTIGQSLAHGAQMKPSQFNQILGRVAGTEHETLVNQVVLRSQSQAEYGPENIGHFGLNLRRYAHFTSPIRRYADLIVHRALISALNLGPDGLTDNEAERLGTISELISTHERRAMAAERDTVDRLIAAHLAERVGESFEARVSGVTKAGLFVQLPDLGADGFVPVATLGREYYIFDEAARALVGDRTGGGYQLSDIVDVRLAEVAPLAGALRFEMLSEPKAMRQGTRSFHKAKVGKERQRARIGQASRSQGRGRRK